MHRPPQTGIPLTILTAGLTFLFIVLLLVPGPSGLEKIQVYLPLHSMLEFLTVSIAIMIFVIGWYNRNNLHNRSLTVLAIGFLAVAIFDFVHIFTVQGMPAFIAENYPGRGIIYWFAARFAAAFSLLAFVLLARQQANTKYCSAVLAGALVATTALLWIEIYHPDWLPVMLVPGQGLTAVKVFAEYLLFGLYVAAAVLLWRLRSSGLIVQTMWLASATWVMGLSELFFTLYHQITDFYNVVGHIYKSIAFAMLFWAVFVQVVRDPVSKMLRAQSALEHAYDDLERRVAVRTNELANLNNSLNDAQRISQLGSWELDLVNNNLHWSDEIYRIFEIDPQEFGASYEAFLNAIHPDDRDKVNKAYTESVAARTEYEIDHRLQMADGRIKFVHERGNTYYARDGKPLRSVGIVQDITQKVMIENRLRETSQLLDSVIENMPNMIFLKDARDLRFLLFNKAGETVLGIPRQDLLGKNDHDLFPAAQAEFFASKDRDVIDSLGFLDIPEEEIDTRSGAKRVLHTKKIALRNDHGETKYLLGISEDITEAVQAKKELEASYRLLNAVVENAHVLIAVLDTNMNFVRVNAGYAAADRKPPEYFIGKNHFELYPNPENETLFRQVIETGEAINVFARPFEYAFNPERGVTHWDWTLTPIKSESGVVTTLVLALLDVTPRINAIEELSRREHELREVNETLELRVQERTKELSAAYEFTDTVLQTVRVLIVVLDRHGGIVRFNRACEELTGYTSAELIGKPIWDYLIPPEQLAGVKSFFQKLHAGHFPNQYENEWLMRDGSRRLFAWSNTCLQDESGTVDFVIATGIDITDSRAAQRQLHVNEEMLRELTENIREVFFIRDVATNRMIYVSPAYESLWGQPRTELLNDATAFMRSVHPDDIESVMDAYQKHRELSQYFNAEYRIVRADGETRWVWARTFPIYDENGAVYRIAGLVEDITERKLGEEKRLQQERLQRETLVREVHHRIKNNLQGVIGLLRQHATRNPALLSSLNSAIAQLSTMAQVHGLQSKDHTQTTALCDLIEAIASNVVGLTGVAVVPQVARQLPQPVPVAQDESVPLALILNELIFNAVKHGDSETVVPIKIFIEQQPTGIIVRISNRATVDRLNVDFESNTGLGTGLSLVRALLPREAKLEIRQEGVMVITELMLSPPIVMLPLRNEEICS